MTQELPRSSQEFSPRLERRIDKDAARIARLALTGRDQFSAHLPLTELVLFLAPADERNCAETAIRDRAFGKLAAAGAQVELAFYTRREDFGNGPQDGSMQVVVTNRDGRQLPIPEGSEVYWQGASDVWKLQQAEQQP